METVIKNAVTDLEDILQNDQISTNPTILEQHSKDESYHKSSLPDVVVFPKCNKEVSEIVQIAAKHKLHVTPFGLGSCLEGHVIPYEHGITIDFSLMNKVLEIREKDFIVKVQPGVTRKQLNNELKKYGLFFPVDPGANATIGGMTATNASGTMSVRYGIMRDNVRNLEVVLADGSIIHTGNSAAKSSSGLHLNGLFVGSEGTLGCFTEITLKVYGIPEHITAARASFQTINEAVEAVVAIRQAGIPVARMELVDEPSMVQVNQHMDSNYQEVPTLFLEFHGNEAGLKQDVAFTEEIVKDFNCIEIHFETDNAKRNQLWDARHNLAYAYIHAYRGRKLMVTDVCLPISELAGAIHHAREALDTLHLPGGIVGHVGDGNYHALIMVNTEDSEEIQKAEAFNKQIVDYSLSRGGTCTGEHGVGIGKAKYQQQEHGDALNVMKSIKKALDPTGLFNPGKIF
ncbi:FAD-binding oxidoreductase [Oceanobacillus halophilus]|uniref:D-lactate dehydrogenase (cytochrome) n=1 Tax=Oceanobacillus halophilus TaxID=930130 RepID=A0A495AB27_9BACI|nr:FAD-linked oxidase C-terminal domain-containing protein [Oceanobacillus halophilus]RKQ37281.1 FAD-binding protein [Oceanobacillus halophilus]